MKKSFFTLITLLSLLVLSTGTVFAADGYLELREVRNDAQGGVIFVFDVVGEFSKADFKGSFLTFGDNRLPVDCNLQGSVLQCTTSQASAGQYITLNVGGFIFWTRVPEKAPAQPTTTTITEYCYGIYDVYYDESEEEHSWQQFATHCQDVPANYGDLLEDFENPDIGYPFDYEFFPNSPQCYANIVNINAYYGGCPQ